MRLHGGTLRPPQGAGPSQREKELAAENARLKAQLAKKDGVIAEIAAEYTQLKKRARLDDLWVHNGSHGVLDA